MMRNPLPLSICLCYKSCRRVKTVRLIPLEKQLPRESRKMWAKVTDHLLKKEYSDATKEKIAIEQRQRDEAGERKRNGIQFTPVYFEQNLEKGYSLLTPEGHTAVKEQLEEGSPDHIEGSQGAKPSS